MLKNHFNFSKVNTEEANKYRDVIYERMNIVNAKRGLNTLWLGTILELFLIIVYDIPNIIEEGFYANYNNYYFILHSVILLFTTFGWIRSYKIVYKKPIKFLKKLSFEKLIIVFSIVFLASLTLINSFDQTSNSSISIYLSYILVISVLVLMKPKYMGIVMVITHVVFVFSMSIFQTNSDILFSNITNGTILTICAFIIAYIFHNNFFQITYKSIKLEEVSNELKLLSNTDPLTKIYNRRFFYEYMSNEKNGALKNKQVSYMMFDIDSFKSINDTYGHVVGDEMLVAFANLLSKKVDQLELVVRWGGEEFLLVLINRSQNHIIKLTNEILDECQKIYSKALSRRINMTVSVGISNMDLYDYEELDKYVSLADKAMYQAKNAGKNRYNIIKGDKENE